MNDQLSALLWLFAWVGIPVVVLLWLKWRGASMVRAFLETERRNARARLATDADHRQRRALWFSMLDQLYVRYTGLLETSRAKPAKRAPSRRRA